MNTKESERSFAVLEGCYLHDRPKALLEFAKANGFLSGVVTTPGGDCYPATQYCMELYCNATKIEEEHQLFQQIFGAAYLEERFQNSVQDAFQIVCLMLAMEKMRNSFWNYGSELRYKIAAAGISITRNEFNAFLAQQGDFSFKANKPNKGALLERNPLAIAIYAADLVTLSGSLHGNLLPSVPMPKELTEKFASCWKESLKESLEAMMQTFCPAFLGDNHWNLKPFMDYLTNSDFYTAPASTKYHGSCQMGLANHNCQLLARLVGLVKPQTEAELGKLVLLTVAHDLCKINVYKTYFTNEKVPGPAMRLDKDGLAQEDKYQTKRWSNGETYHYEEVQKYSFEDALPQGHGQKSLNMILSFFGTAITEEMAAAIDGHMRDLEINPLCDLQMQQYPLCRYLHIADTIASVMDEV